MIVLRVKFFLVTVSCLSLAAAASYPSSAPEEVWRGNWLWMSSDFESDAKLSFDGDEFTDVFIAASDGAYWYEYDEVENGLVLVAKIQDGPAPGYGANAIAVGYLDPDGHMDLVIGEERPNSSYSAPVRWYEANGTNNSYNTVFTCSSTYFGTRPLGNGAGKCGIAFGAVDNDQYNGFVLRRENNFAYRFQSEANNTVGQIGTSQFYSTAQCVAYSDLGTGIIRHLFIGRSSIPQIDLCITNGGSVQYANKLVLPDSQKAVSMAIGDFNHEGNYDLFVVTDSGNVLQYTMSSRWWDGNPIATLDAQVVTGGARCVAMGDIDGDGVVELLVGTSTGIDFYEPDLFGIAAYASTQTFGFAVNDLAVAAYESTAPPPGWVNTLGWVLKPHNDGYWGKPMASYILGMMASNAGLREVYWDVFNYSYALYPSQNFSEKVYNNRKSGHEFDSADMPRLALDVAEFNDLSIKLAVWWESGCAGIVSELLEMYPQAEFIILCNGTLTTEIEAALDGIALDRITIRPNLGPAINLLTAHYPTLRDRYTHDGDVLFYRRIDISDLSVGCKVAITAEQTYHLFVNGQPVGSGHYTLWDELLEIDIYDVSGYLHAGANDFCVVVASGELAGGVLVNVRIGDEILASDKHWQARPVTAPLSAAQVVAYCQETDGWFEPLVQSGSNVWPMPRRMVGPVLWEDWTPPSRPLPEDYAAYLFGVNSAGNVDIYGGGKIDPDTGCREYAIEHLRTLIGPVDLYDIAIGDLDGNGLLDIVCVPAGLEADPRWGYLEQNGNAPDCSVYRYQLSENGELVYKGPIPGVTAKAGRTRLVIGNFDGDPYDDLFVIIQGNPTVYGNLQSKTVWYECSSVEPFQMSQRGANLTHSWSSAVAIGDLNNSGVQDILVACDTSGLIWYYCSGNNSFALSGARYESYMKNIIDIAMGDLDGDGYTDVITIRNPGLLPPSDPHWMNANGVLEWKKMMETRTSINHLTTVGRVDWEFDFVSCAIGDVDGDGRNEIIATKADGTVRFFSPARKEWTGTTDMLGRKPLGHFPAGGHLQDVTDLIRVALNPSVTPPCDLGMREADLNSDCKVDLLDFVLLMELWLTCTFFDDPYYIERPLGDLDYNTFVDLLDFAIMADQWQDCSDSAGCP